MKITSPCLILNTSQDAPKRRVLLRDSDGTLLFDVTAHICPDGNFPATIDVRRFMGKDITITTEEDGAPVACRLSNSLPAPTAQEAAGRPLLHFTPNRGWSNDPNGMVYRDGVYHLYYQHNPMGTDWGNMHWGHATSRDLLRWEDHGVVLFPDEYGTAFSGCALSDDRRVSGLGNNEKAPLLFFYTAAGGDSRLSAGHPFTQRLAVSTDDGKTLHPRDGILISNIVDGNRDPKVIFAEEWQAYAMVLYLTNDRYLLLRSEDLLHWTPMQEIRLPGDNECPDFYPLCLRGERYWIFSGAHERYLIGHLKTDGFVPAGEARSLHHGGHSYAAQSFSGLPGERRVRIAWDRYPIPEQPFSRQMGFPLEMSLTERGGHLCLSALPVPELENALGTPVTLEDKTDADFPTVAALTHLTVPAGASGTMTLNLFGYSVTLDLTAATLCAGEHVLPLTVAGGDIDLLVLTDKQSVEIYLDGGTILCTAGHTFGEERMVHVSGLPEGASLTVRPVCL